MTNISLNDAAAAMYPTAHFHVHDNRIFCVTGGTAIGGNFVSVSSYDGELQWIAAMSNFTTEREIN